MGSLRGRMLSRCKRWAELICTTRLNDQKAIEDMGLNLREVMDLAISTISAMTFSWGFVHCDPHPGNILVRKHPTKRGKPQIVSRERTERRASSEQRLGRAFRVERPAPSAQPSAWGVSPTCDSLQSDPIRCWGNQQTVADRADVH